MIRVATWLHPCLESTVDKVQRLRASLEGVNRAVDDELVIAKARGRSVKKPVPSERMSARGHAAIERAVVGLECHSQALLQALEELKARSSPERLPHVMDGLGDACAQLQKVLASPQFRERLGDAFPRLPPLANMSTGRDVRPALPLADGSCAHPDAEDVSEPEDDRQSSSSMSLPPRLAARRASEPEVSQLDHAHSLDLSPSQDVLSPMCYFPFGNPTRKSSCSTRSISMPASMRRASAQFARAVYGVADSSSLPAASSEAKPDVVSELAPDGWVSHRTPEGRIFWHHTSLGPAPWDRPAAADSVTSVLHDDTGTPSSRQDTNPFEKDLVSVRQETCPTELGTSHVDLQASAAPVPGSEISPPQEETQTMTQAAPDESRSSQTGLAAHIIGGDAPVSRQKSDTLKPIGAAAPAAAESSATEAYMDRGCMRAEVYRLTMGVQGWKRHDCRCLLLTGNQLLIYGKGSMDNVKTVVDVSGGDVERCALVGDGVLSLDVRRKKRRSSSLGRMRQGLSAVVRSSASETKEQKVYFFEFQPQSLAEEFLAIITRLRS
eukprot:TRINITY_DN67106_c0_g1_i1.p1 TRINITY_DN67106_c0_g1~~TRINITY_DN67106_c0_g1_i1.p1  ORF type:complete len:597 (+),score=62.98 TRINITY_DN67106_c0_g1_i1:136-1791(+)